MNHFRFEILLCVLLIFVSVQINFAQTTAFTYQGRLTDSSSPGSGNYLFEFRLFATPTDDTPIEVLTNVLVPVANNIFTAQLNFSNPNAFDGNPRFLEIAVKRNIAESYTTLSPRQPITAAPYAIRALNATTAETSTNTLNVDGTPAAQIVKEGDTRLTDERTPIAGSTNYVQNTTTEQAATDFNVSGNGSANIFNARTQFNIGGNRVFFTSGTNLSVGISSGNSNSPTDGNVFFGYNSGKPNTNGYGNAFFGTESGRSNTTGRDNTFLGFFAGGNNIAGNENSFVGLSAGLQNNGSQNTFFGVGAGYYNYDGNYNTFIGWSAGISPVNRGSRNTLLGAETRLGSGNLNYATAIGAGATVLTSNTVVLGRTDDTVRIPGILNVNTFSADTFSANTVNAANQFNLGGRRLVSSTDSGNTVVGFFAGNNGQANSFFGYDTGKLNTSGSLNSFFGTGAGYSNLTGSENSFFGRSAGVSNTSGFSNSFFGLQSGYSNTTGSNNSFFGLQAGIDNSTGSNNTIIGMNANVGNGNLTYAAALGSGAVVRTSNTIVLGRENGSDKVRIFGLGANGSTALCRNADNEIATCDIGGFTQENRANTEQINALREKIKQQETLLNQQQITIDGLKNLVCAQNPIAGICQ